LSTLVHTPLPLFDAVRFATQRERVIAVMLSGEWFTLGELKSEIAARFQRTDSEAGISARIREFAHEKRVRNGHKHLYEYRMTTAEVK
jgi:hypothetical protein